MKKKVISILVTILIGAIFLIIAYYILMIEIREMNKEFPKIAVSDEIYSTIIEIEELDKYKYRENPYSAYTILNDGRKIHIDVHCNKRYQICLDDIIKPGMLLIKNKDSIFVELMRVTDPDSIKYRFELNNTDF